MKVEIRVTLRYTEDAPSTLRIQRIRKKLALPRGVFVEAVDVREKLASAPSRQSGPPGSAAPRG